MKNIYKIFQPPFKYDDYGQMIFDKNNHLVINIRGWGRLQKEENAEELQDQFGKDVAEALNNFVQQRLSAEPTDIKTSDSRKRCVCVAITE